MDKPKCLLKSVLVLVLFYWRNVFAAVSVLSHNEQVKRLLLEKEKCNTLNVNRPYLLTEPFCNRTWDNIVCWSDTPAGQVARQSCPHYINMFDQGEIVTRVCTDNGTWWVHPAIGVPWSNYSQCGKSSNEQVPELIQEHMPGIKLMYTIGYSLSLATLVMALTIMIYFRRLHCSRNMIHMNMFLAFGIRAAVQLMKNVLLVNDLGFANDVNQTGNEITFIHEGSHWECKMFFTLFYYIIFASVMWLLNEGLYLQLILSVSVFADKIKVRWFVLLGWGYPLLFLIPWILCRISLDDMLCWNIHVFKSLYWILHGPMVASVAINFAIFINIVRMLFTKLTAINCPNSKKVRYRKLAKSTLILIPLFAVYYMGFIWLPDGISPTSDLFKLYVEMLFNSFQGFLVALLFCFLNLEVQYEIRKLWKRRSIFGGGGSLGNSQSHGLLSHRSLGNIHKDQRAVVSKHHEMANLTNGFTTDSRLLNSESLPQCLQSSKTTSSAGQMPPLPELDSQQSNHYKDACGVNSHGCDDVTQPLVSQSPDSDLTQCNIDVHCSEQSSSGKDCGLTSLCNDNYSGPEGILATAPSDQTYSLKPTFKDTPRDDSIDAKNGAEDDQYSNKFTPCSDCHNSLLKLQDDEKSLDHNNRPPAYSPLSIPSCNGVSKSEVSNSISDIQSKG